MPDKSGTTRGTRFNYTAAAAAPPLRVKSDGLREFTTIVLVWAPLASFFYLKSGGQIYPSELVLAVIFPLALTRAPNVCRQDLFKLLGAGGLWLAGTAISALASGSPGSALSKLLANDGFTAVDAAVFYVAICSVRPALRARRLRQAMVGLALAGIIQGTLKLAPYSAAAPWKFGYGTPVALLAAMLCDTFLRRGYRWKSYLPLAVPLAVSLATDFRSLAGWCVAVPLVQAVTRAKKDQRPPREGNLGRRLLMIVVGTVLVILTVAMYRLAVTHGALGQSALLKYKETVGEDHSLLGVFIGGRKDMAFALYGLWHNPILGMGADPQLSTGAFNTILDFFAFRGNPLNPGDLLSFPAGHIEMHSFILDAWLTAGIFGLPFWIYSLRAIGGFLAGQAGSVGKSCALTFLSVAAIWNIFFSPLGASARLLFAFTLAGVLASQTEPR